MKAKINRGIYINCEACNIAIGPGYLNKQYIDVGPDKICLSCYEILKKVGFLYFNINGSNFRILSLDGSEAFIDKEELEELLDPEIV